MKDHVISKANDKALGGILIFHSCWKPRHWTSEGYSALIKWYADLVEKIPLDSALHTQVSFKLAFRLIVVI